MHITLAILQLRIANDVVFYPTADLHSIARECRRRGEQQLMPVDLSTQFFRMQRILSCTCLDQLRPLALHHTGQSY